MEKAEAIQMVEKYLSKKKFSWEEIFLVDKEPRETKKYWVFKNLVEPRETMRGNAITVDRDFPTILVNKKEKNVMELSNSDLRDYDLY